MTKITASVSYTIRYAANDGFEALDARRKLGGGESSKAIESVGFIDVVVDEDDARQLDELGCCYLDARMELRPRGVGVQMNLELPADKLAELVGDADKYRRALGKIWAEQMIKRVLTERVDKKCREVAIALQREKDEQARLALKAAEQARLTRLAGLVREINPGTLTIERLDAQTSDPLGMLPEDEAIRVATNHYLPIGDGLKPYKGMNRGVFTDEDYCDHNVSYQTFAVPSEIEKVTASELATYKAILQTVQTIRSFVKTQFQVHAAKCSRCDEEHRKVGVFAELDLGDGLVIAREYGN